jgi:hypothetical protein
MTLPLCSFNVVLCGFVSVETMTDCTYTASKEERREQAAVLIHLKA